MNDRINFTHAAYLKIIAETYAHPETETGGILPGYHRPGVWHVVDMIDPGYQSIIRESCFFVYDEEYMQHRVEMENRLRKKKLRLLGLWHRHPGAFDRFSNTDRETNARFAAMNKFGAISLIVNLDPGFRVTAYRIDKANGESKIKRLSVGEPTAAEKKSLKSIEEIKKMEMVMEVETAARNRPDDSGRENIERLVALAEIEMDAYLDKQSDYIYRLDVQNGKLTIDMAYRGGMAEYPRRLFFRLFLNDKEEPRVECGGKEFEYAPSFISNYLFAAIERKSAALRFLGISGDFSEESLNRRRNILLKKYHPDQAGDSVQANEMTAKTYRACALLKEELKHE